MKNNQSKTVNNNNNINNNNNNLHYIHINTNNNNNNAGYKLSKSASSPNHLIAPPSKKGLKSKSKSHRLVGRSSSNGNYNNNNNNNSKNHGGKMGGGTKDARRGLEPLEFEECIVDSPEFRDNLNRHEKELDHTSQQIKRIIKEVKDLMSAAKGPGFYKYPEEVLVMASLSTSTHLSIFLAEVDMKLFKCRLMSVDMDVL
ncbi:putative uncharacterized protein DDB_G0292292, partial [Musca vetustissima]|uniref:putative uncharacterized protein DDB_G0292292 n=1 Tax=Musca vetustissima TaxID=27455 RepID=UPI002AB6997A